MADSAAFLEQLSKELADKGKLVESGWVALRLAVIPLDAPAAQLNDMRIAFFAGAQHLWSSIMVVLDKDDMEPTGPDLRRMDAIDAELKVFIAAFEAKYIKRESMQ